MTDPKCATGHDTVSMVYAEDGKWKCPECSRQIPARQGAAEAEAPRGLNLEETLWVLRNTPHEPYERPPEVLAAFERFLQRIEEEEEDESNPVMPDASSEHDKYIYG